MARASQPSPSRPRVPTSTCAWPSSKNAVTHGTQSRLVHRPSRVPSTTSSVAPRSGEYVATYSFSAVSVAVEPATVRPVTSRGWRSGCESSRCSRARRAEPACGEMHAVQVGRQGRGGPLVVAEHQHPQPVAEVGVLGLDDLAERDGLRLAAREHPVDGAAAATDAALGELVPDRRQHVADPLERRRRPGPWYAGAPPSPPAAASSRRPSGSCRCRSASRTPSGLGSSPACTIRSVASYSSVGCGSASHRLWTWSKNETEPYVGSLSAVVSSRNRSPCSASQSFSRAVGVVSQASSANGARSPSRTTAGMLTVNTESPNSSSTSSFWSPVSVSGGVAVRPSTNASGSSASTSLSSRPHTSSRWWHSSSTSVRSPTSLSRSTRARPLGCSRSSRLPPRTASRPASSAFLVDLVVGVEGGEGLVRQRREPSVERPRGAARLVRQLLPAAQPLRLDRGVRPEHDGGASASACRVEPDQGLAGARREHHPGPAGAGGLGLLHGVEGLALVGAERVRRRRVLRRRLLHGVHPRRRAQARRQNSRPQIGRRAFRDPRLRG